MRGRDGAYHRPITSDHTPIRLFLADVDGTLVTQDKVLTDDAVAAVRSLRQAGVLFAITSGRPPRGMEMLIEPLQLDTPIAAFNGGLLVDKDMQVLEQRVIPEDLVGPRGRPHEVLRPRRLALPRRGLVRARPQGPPRRPGGLDGQVRRPR